jgi:hypothetical protein
MIFMEYTIDYSRYFVEQTMYMHINEKYKIIMFLYIIYMHQGLEPWLYYRTFTFKESLIQILKTQTRNGTSIKKFFDFWFYKVFFRVL